MRGLCPFLLLPRAIPYGSERCEGGLRTVLEGLRDLGFPCVHVLSVAGFSALSLLFPLGRRVIPEHDYLLIYLGFLTFLRLMTPTFVRLRNPTLSTL